MFGPPVQIAKKKKKGKQAQQNTFTPGKPINVTPAQSNGAPSTPAPPKVVTDTPADQLAAKASLISLLHFANPSSPLSLLMLNYIQPTLI